MDIDGCFQLPNSRIAILPKLSRPLDLQKDSYISSNQVVSKKNLSTLPETNIAPENRLSQ